MVFKAPFSVSRRDTCRSYYVGTSEYTAECIYVPTSGGDYKCQMLWPPIYACPTEDVSSSSPPPPSPPTTLVSSPPPPPSPPPPSPPPPPLPSSSPPDTLTSSECGLHQPYTATKINLWDSGRWCGSVIRRGSFSLTLRSTCESYYVGRPDYVSDCIYESLSTGEYSCKLRWPPTYPCEGANPSALPSLSSPPLPPPPSPSPPPPSSPPVASISDASCGLDQPFTKTKVNLWDRQLWCPQAVPTGPFSTARRDACHNLFVGRQDYTSECLYESTGDGNYKCKLSWPPIYPCK